MTLPEVQPLLDDLKAKLDAALADPTVPPQIKAVLTSLKAFLIR